MAQSRSEFDRGVTAGGIAERLAGHDRRLDAINGNMADHARSMAALVLVVEKLTAEVRRVADQRDADILTRDATALAVEKTVTTTAAAVESERLARRDSDEAAWSPWQKVLAVVGGLAVVVGVVLAALR